MSSPLLDIRNIDFDAQSKVIQKVLREFETDPLLVSKRYSSRLPTKFHWHFLEKLFPNWIEKTFTQLLMSSPEETMSNLFDVRESIEYSERFASRWFPIILVIVLFLLIGSCLSLFGEISQVPVLPMTSGYSQVYYHQSYVSLCISKRVSPFGHSYSFSFAPSMVGCVLQESSPDFVDKMRRYFAHKTLGLCFDPNHFEEDRVMAKKNAALQTKGLEEIQNSRLFGFLVTPTYLAVVENFNCTGVFLQKANQ